MFKAGHSYALKTSLTNTVLCVAVNRRTSAFKTQDSFSIKSNDKFELYQDLGVKANFRSILYWMAG